MPSATGRRSQKTPLGPTCARHAEPSICGPRPPLRPLGPRRVAPRGFRRQARSTGLTSSSPPRSGGTS
eukprot:10130729-Alexandrium_andersonii.AAC.1